ncbi:MAG: CPBP family intramembrane metalloprotease [Prolixibacteraceae bacterium]|nr:CPBP family intramembrane metalloprotease [Prolixibacteraceae bacterium]
MNELIRKLTPAIELFIVLILGFGLFIYSSTRGFFVVNSNYNHSWTYKITSQGDFSIVIYETVALLIILYILKIRNWSISDFNLDFTLKMIWIGLLIMFVRNVIGNIGYKIFELVNVVDKTTLKHVQFGLESNWVSISLIIIVNSIYEEFILIGYFFKRLEKYHPALVIGLSMFIRLSYHTYQGWMSLFAIVPTGLVFGYYYYKYKKLWPLIIAHGFWNLIASLGMHFHWLEKLHDLNG